eukprot:TRINITY_DN10122_c0_g1_i1.p1 TRINITY_DN10122_c0_g1~~TRINITY_DN10122_c0_g1_i1.p1  ORF type:complete len:769 (-),score=134.94 TRINITY_DN10122_c0_g1_i1:123-2429(-)
MTVEELDDAENSQEKLHTRASLETSDASAGSPFRSRPPEIQAPSSTSTRCSYPVGVEFFQLDTPYHDAARTATVFRLDTPCSRATPVSKESCIDRAENVQNSTDTDTASATECLMRENSDVETLSENATPPKQAQDITAEKMSEVSDHDGRAVVVDTAELQCILKRTRSGDAATITAEADCATSAADAVIDVVADAPRLEIDASCISFDTTAEKMSEPSDHEGQILVVDAAELQCVLKGASSAYAAPTPAEADSAISAADAVIDAVVDAPRLEIGASCMLCETTAEKMSEASDHEGKAPVVDAAELQCILKDPSSANAATHTAEVDSATSAADAVITAVADAPRLDTCASCISGDTNPMTHVNELPQDPADTDAEEMPQNPTCTEAAGPPELLLNTNTTELFEGKTLADTATLVDATGQVADDDMSGPTCRAKRIAVAESDEVRVATTANSNDDVSDCASATVNISASVGVETCTAADVSQLAPPIPAIAEIEKATMVAVEFSDSVPCTTIADAVGSRDAMGPTAVPKQFDTGSPSRKFSAVEARVRGYSGDAHAAASFASRAETTAALASAAAQGAAAAMHVAKASVLKGNSEFASAAKAAVAEVEAARAAAKLAATAEATAAFAAAAVAASADEVVPLAVAPNKCPTNPGLPPVNGFLTNVHRGSVPANEEVFMNKPKSRSLLSNPFSGNANASIARPIGVDRETPANKSPVTRVARLQIPQQRSGRGSCSCWFWTCCTCLDGGSLRYCDSSEMPLSSERCQSSCN